MGLYREHVLPRLVDLALGGAPFAELRQRAAAGLEGRVLEVGFGSGRNLAHLPAEVSLLLAVEPAAGGRRLARKRVAQSSIPVEYVGLEGESIPLEGSSVDHVLSTWTLCTIPGVEQALGEMRRVLRPGGALHFLEHGRSPESTVSKWQDRLTPLQQRLAGGCHLNRQVDELVRDAGFEIERLSTFYMRGPRLLTYMFEGRARRL